MKNILFMTVAIGAFCAFATFAGLSVPTDTLAAMLAVISALISSSW